MNRHGNREINGREDRGVGEKYAGEPVRKDGAGRPDQRSEEREHAAAK